MSRLSTISCSLLALLARAAATDNSTAAPEVQLDFKAVDGGFNRGCAGSSESDIGPGHYLEFHGLSSLDACKTYCIYNSRCKGIEYSKQFDGQRCRVWTRSGGIEATVGLQDYICLSFTSTLEPGTHCGDWRRVVGTGAIESEDGYECRRVDVDGRRLLLV
eukprot:gb/GFBE01038376.1/.p1 GENE.gb/GFBE01038376.1/~~gb/GFBE01038376.1/.p1  ORF type:complete len:161 (+),score=30.01 gb/GFBE01038376.1/:1-483(+)